MMDVELFGVDAGSSLLINVVLHILNSLLLYVFRRWAASWWPAFIVATLFALHPIGVESVAWVASRKTLLSSFFWILTLFAYSLYVERPGMGRYSAVVLCFILGLMAKPMLVTLPFVLLLMDYWPLGRLKNERIGSGPREISIRIFIEKIPLLALSILSISLSMLSLQEYDSYMPYGAIPMDLRIGNALISYLAYLGKFFWPVELSVYYPFPNDIPLWQSVGAVLVLAGLTISAWRMGRNRPYLIVGWFWYMGTLTPVIGLVRAGLWPAMADRFAYIPYIGLYLIIGWGSVDVFVERFNSRICCALIASLMVILTASTWKQVAYWKDSLTLFSHAIEVDNSNFIAHNNIGKSLIEKGQIELAARHYEIALVNHPNYVSAHINLGAALSMQGRTEEAVFHLLEALRMNPYQADAHYVLGNILAEKGLVGESIGHFEKAIAIDPDYFEAHNNVANILARQGRFDDALQHYKRALQINPHYAKAYNNLGTALYQKDRVKEAIINYRLAIDNHADYAEAHNNLGVALKKQGQVKRSVIHYQKALQLKPDYGEAHYNLGLVMVYIGEIENAVLHFEDALRIKPDDVQIKLQLEKTREKLNVINAEIEALNTSIASNKARPDLHTKLGDLFKKKGNSQKATECYRKALTYNNGYVPALKKLGSIYASEGKFNQAIPIFKKIASLESKNAEACYWLAGLFAVQRQTDNSVEWLAMAVDRGYSEWEQMKNDPKLRSIRGTDYFKELIKRTY